MPNTSDSGQGVYVYANNGDHAKAARTEPTVPSGVLAEWDGKAGKWTIVRRNQFTEITGPGGIHGNFNSATDPIWVVGWDSKSLLLGVRDAKSGWSFFRLPKGSHSYDGAHGWNTEWPRIREIGEDDFLMTMHGTFWKFPKTFTAATNHGIRPRSNYLKVIGDFCRWNDKIAFGCDDTAKNEFLNKRKAKGEIAAPQSQSNLWFVNPEKLDHLGPVIGRGAVWMREKLDAGAASDPYLFAGYQHRGLHLSHSGSDPWKVILETGSPNETWAKHSEVSVIGYAFVSFETSAPGEWIRLRSTNVAENACAAFTYRNDDTRTENSDPIFDGLAKSGDTAGGIVKARSLNVKTLSFAALTPDGKHGGYYELDATLKLKRIKDAETEAYTRSRAAIPTGSLTADAASVVFTDDSGKRWRLPKGDVAFDSPRFGGARIAREVATERDLLNAHGTFYELPANNAGGIAKLRPVATHNRLVHDFCSYRGLLVMSGVAQDAPATNPHILRSDDGKAALWAGTIDDIWKLGKPRGQGGPWSQTKSIEHAFPAAFSAYWIRFVSDQDGTATATLTYR